MSDMQHDWAAISNWLSKCLPLDAEFSIQPLTNDASLRQYFRIQQYPLSWILMLTPCDPGMFDFINLSLSLYRAGLKIPRLNAVNLAQGWLLCEDFGNNSFSNALQSMDNDFLYHKALMQLIAWQQTTAKYSHLMPRYSYEFLAQQLNIFLNWCLRRFLELDNLARISKLLSEALINVWYAYLQQPQVLVHSDYHCRNLMVLNRCQIGILDFQDAKIGPVAYDLISLLQDAYLDLPEAKVASWYEFYFEHARQADILRILDYQQFWQQLQLIAWQRHLKIIGVFCRLQLKYGKGQFLASIPRVIGYLQNITANCCQLSKIDELLSAEVWPRLIAKCQSQVSVCDLAVNN